MKRLRELDESMQKPYFATHMVEWSALVERSR
jgi:hypothetical protein